VLIFEFDPFRMLLYKMLKNNAKQLQNLDINLSILQYNKMNDLRVVSSWISAIKEIDLLRQHACHLCSAGCIVPK
jgi:hypothetical protein